MTDADARETASRLHATAAGLRRKGQHADAEHLDDLADQIERRGLADGIDAGAAQVEAKGEAHKARALRAVASSIRKAPAPGHGGLEAGAIALALGVGILAIGARR